MRRSNAILNMLSHLRAEALPNGNKGDYDRAIADFNEVIRLDPKYAVSISNRGLANERKGQLRPSHCRLQGGHPTEPERRHRFLP